MKPEVFEFKTNLSVPAREVFAWHKRPGAFEALSPPWADVSVVERIGDIESGRVVLAVGPSPVSLRWELEHTNYVEGEQFQDHQISGPFQKWCHTHSFHKNGEGCTLEDRVEFELPPYVLLDTPVAEKIKDELKRMFNYRQEILENQLKKLPTGGEVMKVALSGSHGLVGSTLAPLLTTQGHEVRRIVRTGKAPDAGDISCNLSDRSSDFSFVEEVDAIIHLSGESIASGRWTDDKKRELRESRIKSTTALSEAIAKASKKPKVLVCASAIGYYGNRGSEALDEASSNGAGFLAELCRDWEAATQAASAAGVRVVNARLGIVLSPRGGALAKMLTPFMMGAGGNIGCGDQYMSWIAVDDVAGAIFHSLNDHSLSGPVNLVAPNPVTNADYTKVLGKVIHRPTVFPMPAFAAKLAFGEMADELLLASQNVDPKKLKQSNYSFMYPELEGALHHVLGR